jgi:hypothetical protein
VRRTVVLALALAARSAQADPWIVTFEGGAEADTNVQHVESGPGIADAPVAAGVVRLGGRIDHKDHLLGGTYALSASGLTRTVLDNSVQVEDVALLAGNVRWLHPVGDRPVSIGFDAIAIDDIPTSDDVGARTFSNFGGDGLLVLKLAEDRTLSFAAGGRSFVYKPDHDFDWIGPTAAARLDLVLWQPSGGTRTLALATTLSYEARAYNSHALANACAPGARPDPTCLAPTDLLRRDRYQRIGVELTWLGSSVIAVGYQLAIIDSNDFGQSLARHKVTASVTASLPWDLYFTAVGTLELDQYLDGLIVATDETQRNFENLDDENESSVQLRLARAVSSSWSIEARAAAWRDLGSNIMDTAYKRSLVYLGAIFTSN